ncbi:acyl carrier protein [Sphaerisporangium aureirubrum]|uniref:Acyl carrier protein n=1 Tax=Sphaerisporangium aureirubrum TaxID=1544736 RepID=A0ABW1NIN9_9ACTN
MTESTTRRTAVDAARLRRDLADMIASASGGEVRADDVLTTGHSLSALGLTSLARIRLIDALEDTYGVDVDLSGDLSSFESVDALATHVADLLAGKPC